MGKKNRPRKRLGRATRLAMKMLEVSLMPSRRSTRRAAAALEKMIERGMSKWSESTIDHVLDIIGGKSGH